jgi:hypothetical protein
VLAQFRLEALLAFFSKDRLRLLGSFSFFAPDPVEADFHLIYRLILPDAKIQPWTEIPIVRYRSVFAVLWNPQRRLHAAVRLALFSMARHVSNGRKEPIEETPPYLMLLNLAIRHAPCKGAASIQYGVLRSRLFPVEDQPTLVLKSGLHAISSE